MSSIIVTNISPDVTEQQVGTFFSFCGKINSIQLQDASSPDGEKQKCAKITFEKDAAAKTALLLTDTKLGNKNVVIEPGPSSGLASYEEDGSDERHPSSRDVDQEDKPKSAVIAEMLSHGYVLSDRAVQKSAEFDKEHGVSSRFQKFLLDVDEKYKISNRASETAASVDSKYNISDHAESTKHILHRYFEKAMDNTAGTKVRNFYADATKSANDIHKEARRLADLREGKANGVAFDDPHKTSLAGQT